jgi:hypothetical protein
MCTSYPRFDFSVCTPDVREPDEVLDKELERLVAAHEVARLTNEEERARADTTNELCS